MTEHEERMEATANSLGALLQRAADASSAANDQVTRARLLRRAAGGNHAEKRRQWWFALPALALSVALVVWWWMPSTLSYRVVGGKQDGAYVSAPSDHAVQIQFSDETRVELMAGSQLRIEEPGRRGARVFLERGRASGHVVHRGGARWTFAAGPCEVLVTGTRFELAWDPLAEVFELKLREGSVEIQTPIGAAPIALRAGQEFRADLRQRSITTRETLTPTGSAAVGAAPAAPTPSADGEAPALDAEAQASAKPNLAAPGARSVRESGREQDGAREPELGQRAWRKLIAAGQFAAVLSEAEQRGTERCVQSCNASDLSALADAARYSGRAPLADRCLRSLRARFASEPEGRGAAFLLGRLSERGGRPRDARTWYEQYLKETPGGGYAAEALAGKMRTVLALEGRSAAVPVANEYLRRYPSGVEAASARDVLGAH